MDVTVQVVQPVSVAKIEITGGSTVSLAGTVKDVGSNVRVYTWVLSYPTVGGVLGPRLNENHTVTRIDAFTDSATSVSFNIEQRDTIGTPGTNISTSEVTATPSGVAQTSGFSLQILSSGKWLYLDISSVSGTPAQLAVCLTCTV